MLNSRQAGHLNESRVYDTSNIISVSNFFQIL